MITIFYPYDSDCNKYSRDHPNTTFILLSLVCSDYDYSYIIVTLCFVYAYVSTTSISGFSQKNIHICMYMYNSYFPAFTGFQIQYKLFGTASAPPLLGTVYIPVPLQGTVYIPVPLQGTVFIPVPLLETSYIPSPLLGIVFIISLHLLRTVYAPFPLLVTVYTPVHPFCFVYRMFVRTPANTKQAKSPEAESTPHLPPSH